MLTLQDDEEPWLAAPSRSFELQVLAQHLRKNLRQRERSLPLAFALNSNSMIAEDHIVELELEHLARAQPAEQHEVNDGEISVAREAPKKTAHLIGGERLDELTRLADTQFANST